MILDESRASNPEKQGLVASLDGGAGTVAGVPVEGYLRSISRPTLEVHLSAPVQQVPGLKRIDLQEHDLSAPGRVVIQNRIEFSPDAPAFRHKHPGEEITYVLDGSVEYSIDAQPPQTYSAGDALMVPPETVHAVRNVGSGGAALLSTYIIEKGKPFLVVVD